MEKKSFGKLEYLYHAGVNDTAVIMFHGYGANAEDLYPLSGELNSLKDCHWYFPQGLFDLPSFYPMFKSCCWFELRPDWLTASGREMFMNLYPEQFHTSQSVCTEFIKQIPQKKIILAGFSQGAMMAYHLALSPLIDSQMLILYSSCPFGRKKMDELVINKKLPPTFFSHGTQDTVISYDLAEKLSVWLSQHASHYQFHTFEDGHTIPFEVIEKTNLFVQQNLS